METEEVGDTPFCPRIDVNPVYKVEGLQFCSVCDHTSDSKNQKTAQENSKVGEWGKTLNRNSDDDS